MSKEVLELLTNYVDMTGDIQTASMVAIQVRTSMTFSAKREPGAPVGTRMVFSAKPTR